MVAGGGGRGGGGPVDLMESDRWDRVRSGGDRGGCPTPLTGDGGDRGLTTSPLSCDADNEFARCGKPGCARLDADDIEAVDRNELLRRGTGPTLPREFARWSNGEPCGGGGTGGGVFFLSGVLLRLLQLKNTKS